MAETPINCSHDECSDLGVSDSDVTCLRGRCSLGLDCDRGHVAGTPLPPECPEGMAASVAEDQWGPCVPADECTPSTSHEYPMELYAGVWLIGWEDDALHFSVLRFPPEVDTSFDGDVELLADPGIRGNLPYFECSGVSSFMATESAGTFIVRAPPECDATDGLFLAFVDFGDANGRWGCTLRATVESLGADHRELESYWFPADTCDSPMTTCSIVGP